MTVFLSSSLPEGLIGMQFQGERTRDGLGKTFFQAISERGWKANWSEDIPGKKKDLNDYPEQVGTHEIGKCTVHP